MDSTYYGEAVSHGVWVNRTSHTTRLTLRVRSIFKLGAVGIRIHHPEYIG